MNIRFVYYHYYNERILPSDDNIKIRIYFVLLLLYLGYVML